MLAGVVEKLIIEAVDAAELHVEAAATATRYLNVWGDAATAADDALEPEGLKLLVVPADEGGILAHAPVDRATRRRVPGGHGQLEFGAVIDVDDLLNGALAHGRSSQHQAAVPVLDGTGDDLGRRSGHVID